MEKLYEYANTAWEFLFKRKLSVAWFITAIAGLIFFFTNGAAFVAQSLGVLAWKALLISVGTKLSHALWKQMFHYVDCSELIRSDSANSGRIFMSKVIFVCVVVLALAYGV